MDLCKQYFAGSAISDVFVLTYDQMRRYQGSWHIEKRLLLPANVLVESDNENILKDQLDIWNMDSQKQSMPQCLRLDTQEENFLRFLCGNQKHVEMSRGIIYEGRIQIIEGPLRGLEEQIRKIDRHKRLAKIETHRGWNIRYLLAGLEIMEKYI